MIYLTSPYSNEDWFIRKQRFAAACRVTAILMQRGHMVFSPIAHSYPIARFGLPTDWRFWQRYDCEFLKKCSELWVLMIPGWESSVGVRAEVEIAKEMGKPVYYLCPTRLTITTTPTFAGAVGRDSSGQNFRCVVPRGDAFK